MKFKGIVCIIILGILTFYSTTFLYAKTSKKPIFRPFDNNTEFDYVGSGVPYHHVGDSSKYPFRYFGHVGFPEFGFGSLQAEDYVARKDRIKITVSKPDEYGYVDTVATYKIGRGVFNKARERIDGYIDIFNLETHTKYLGDITDFFYNKQEQLNGIIFTQVFDRYTGINLLSGLEDYKDDSTGIEYKQACVFKAKGKVWVVQAEATKQEPTKAYPNGSIIIKVHHPKEYDGCVFSQVITPININYNKAVDFSTIKYLDFNKKFKVQDNMFTPTINFNKTSDVFSKHPEIYWFYGITYYTASGK